MVRDAQAPRDRCRSESWLQIISSFGITIEGRENCRPFSSENLGYPDALSMYSNLPH